MNIELFVKDWGYWAVFLGSMVEGESIILTASALSALGHLSIVKVGALTFLGTLIADQGIYWLGAWCGRDVLAYLQRRLPKLQAPIRAGLTFLKRNEVMYILSFRFIYGIRIISPFIIGSQGISFMEFAWLNAVSAAIWMVVSCAIGYLAGAFLSQFIQHLGVLIAVMVMSVVSVTVWLGHRKVRTLRQQEASHNKTDQTESSQDLATNHHLAASKEDQEST